ncbi:unnamed protein product [Ostreobium quekettii]|uniref:Nucleoporin NDC1 n=1 Tax=Ostreobium quekettii TaxID=121088 RepID=A0A8S1IVK0_9CHLO|nr:unnamed protein product [Ostreobium quekettii]
MPTALGAPSLPNTSWAAALDVAHGGITGPRLLRVAGYQCAYIFASGLLWTLPSFRWAGSTAAASLGWWMGVEASHLAALAVTVFGCSTLEPLGGLDPPRALARLPVGALRAGARMSLRAGGVEDVAKVLMLYIAFAAAGALCFCPLLGAEHSGSGAVIGGLYCAWWLCSGQDEINYPPVHRRWWFQLKHSLPNTAQVSILLALASLFCHVLQQHDFNSVGILMWSSFCVWCWCGMNTLLHSVLSERHRFDLTERVAGHDAANCELIQLLKRPPNKIVQGLVYEDLCRISEEHGVYPLRRELIFGSEQGADIWTAITKLCLLHLQQIMVQLMECLPPKPGDKTAVTRGPAAARRIVRNTTLHWAVGTIRGSYHQTTSCIRALGGLVVASFSEDHYGHVQLGDPGLQDIVVALLDFMSLTIALTDHAVALSAPARRRRALSPFADGMEHIDCGLDALADTLRSTLHAVICRFDVRLRQALKGPKSKGLHLKSQSDVLGFLDKMLKGEL